MSWPRTLVSRKPHSIAFPRNSCSSSKRLCPEQSKATQSQARRVRCPQIMILRAADQKAASLPGGTLRIADTRNFPIATEVAAAIIEVAPRSMREIHWHPEADEWQYYLSGTGRMTVFASQD